jgi:hypothetical protein
MARPGKTGHRLVRRGGNGSPWRTSGLYAATGAFPQARVLAARKSQRRLAVLTRSVNTRYSVALNRSIAPPPYPCAVAV